MSRINAVENATVGMRAGRKLAYGGKEQVETGLLVEIPKIEVRTCHDG